MAIIGELAEAFDGNQLAFIIDNTYVSFSDIREDQQKVTRMSNDGTESIDAITAEKRAAGILVFACEHITYVVHVRAGLAIALM